MKHRERERGICLAVMFEFQRTRGSTNTWVVPPKLLFPDIPERAISEIGGADTAFKLQNPSSSLPPKLKGTVADTYVCPDYLL